MCQVAILTDEQLTSLMAASRAMGMEPLVEVANAPEMKRAPAPNRRRPLLLCRCGAEDCRAVGALALKAKVIGINNRNLHDFTVDMANTTALTAGLGALPICLQLCGSAHVAMRN